MDTEGGWYDQRAHLGIVLGFKAKVEGTTHFHYLLAEFELLARVVLYLGGWLVRSRSSSVNIYRALGGSCRGRARHPFKPTGGGHHPGLL